MAHETGDIIIFDGTPGHVGMYYDANTIIHAQRVSNFHKDPVQGENNGQVTYLGEGQPTYRPPWARCTDKAGKQQELQRVADAIARFATYGAYRAIRLFLGSTRSSSPRTASSTSG